MSAGKNTVPIRARRSFGASSSVELDAVISKARKVAKTIEIETASGGESAKKSERLRAA